MTAVFAVAGAMTWVAISPQGAPEQPLATTGSPELALHAAQAVADDEHTPEEQPIPELANVPEGATF
ncbi:MAG: hypothetical protein ACRCV9_01215 [Burkholderiaceae bacterium]